MATLLIGAAVNIGVSILLNQFFGPEGQDVVQEGPRLDDLSVSSSAYGETVNIGYGTHRMGGQIIWSTGLIETPNTVEQEGGGKGGAGGGSVTTTTYTYSTSVAVAIAEGVVRDVTRIWADSKLIFDASQQDVTQGKVSFRFYPGTDDQLPDSAIQADRGAANAPAFRGIAYVVFEDLQLADFGNRLPNFSFEVAVASADSFPRTDPTDPTGLLAAVGSTEGDEFVQMLLDPRNDVLTHLEAVVGGWVRVQASSMTALSAVDGRGSFLRGRPGSLTMDGRFVFASATDSGSSTNYAKWDPITGQQVYVVSDVIVPTVETSRIGTLQTTLPAVGPERLIVIARGSGLFANPQTLLFLREDDDGNGATLLSSTDDFNEDDDWGSFVVDFFNERLFLVAESSTLHRIYEIRPNISIGLLGPSLGTPDVEHLVDLAKSEHGAGELTGQCLLPGERAVILGNLTNMVKVDLDTGAVLAARSDLGFTSRNCWSTGGLFGFVGLGTAAASGGQIFTVDTGDLTTFSQQQMSDFMSDVTDGEPGAVSDTGYAYDSRNNSLLVVRQESVSASDLSPKLTRIFLGRAAGQGVTLRSVVEDLCLRAGLESSEFDASPLVGTTVRGLVFNNQGAVRRALETLSSGYLFEVTESDGRVKFVPRGGTSVATIVEDDVGVGERRGRQNDRFTQTSTQEVELPRRVTVRYSDRDRDYQQGAQSSSRTLAPVRLVRSEEERNLDVPLVLTAQEARQLSERLLYTAWVERRSVETRVPWRYVALDPTDVFELEAPRSKGVSETLVLRGSTLETGADLTIDLRAVVQDARTNDSDVQGDAGAIVPAAVPNTLPSVFHPLDLPLLSAADATFQQLSRGYFGMSGQGTGWPGALLFRSRDGGLTFTEVGAVAAETAYGQTTQALADPVELSTWNRDQSLTISVLAGKDQFQSRTDLEVLNGANALAVVKANGDVEIIQFTDVTDNGGGSLTLSGFLRGRRGTEPLATGHASGERVVLLQAGRILTLNIELADIDTTLRYVPTTLGTLIEDNFPTDFAYTGRDLQPYSVARLAAVDNAGNIDLTWTRRTRFNGELRDGTGEVPLNENGERYEVDIQINGGVVARTLEATTNAATYTSGDQGNDNVVSTDTLTFTVYQISEVVGRGLPVAIQYVVP